MGSHWNPDKSSHSPGLARKAANQDVTPKAAQGLGFHSVLQKIRGQMKNVRETWGNPMENMKNMETKDGENMEKIMV